MFYGIPEDDLKRVYDLVVEFRDLYAKHGLEVYTGDMMVVAARNFSFFADKRFVEVFTKHCREEQDKFKLWKLHTLAWAMRVAAKVEGDYVECGVYKGFYSAVLTEYLDFAKLERKFYLYDTFSGLDPRYSTAEERRTTDPYYDLEGIHESVCERFAAYDNVEVVKGVVPDVLEEVSPTQVCYLHLDMNAALAEIAALEVLFERMPDGGVIVFDDYGSSAQRNLYEQASRWMRDHDHDILELPTAQGLVIKHGG